MKTLVLLFSMLALAAPQDPKKLYLRKADGDAVSGWLISLQNNEVKLKVSVLGGTMTVTYELDEFAPSSIWRLGMIVTPPNDFASHFAMARKAARLGLLTQAGTEGRAAIESSKDSPQHDANRTEVRRWAAKALETMIEEALAGNDLKQAQHCLKLLTTRLADMRSEAELDAVAKTVEAVEQAKRQRKSDARQRRLDQKARDAIKRRLSPIQKNVEKGDTHYRNAVRKSRSTATSSRLCEQAIDSYKKAWKAFKALLEKHPDDQHLATVTASMSQHIHNQAIRAALHAANMLTVQSDYKGALEWTRRILVFDPDNAEAKAMVRTIQIAEAEASERWGWGWRIVGDRNNPGNPRNR